MPKNLESTCKKCIVILFNIYVADISGNQAFPEMPSQLRKFRNCLGIWGTPGISGNAYAIKAIFDFSYLFANEGEANDVHF
jgi:hypothetical protein